MIKQQEATKMDNALTIQIQFPDGRTACRSQSDQVKLVGTPGKMLVPVVPSWMKERNSAASGRIKGMGFIVLGTVTPLTGQGQIIVGALTTLQAGYVQSSAIVSRRTPGRGSIRNSPTRVA